MSERDEHPAVPEAGFQPAKQECNPVIQLTNLSRTFGTGDGRIEALRGVNLKVQRGDFLAVMGPSGSGKSTLLHLIGGLDSPTNGEVQLDDASLEEMNEDELTVFRRDRIGFVFQAFNLLDVLTVMENVSLPLEIGGLSEAQAAARAVDVLSKVGLQDREKHLPGQLSGGQQQRLAIARALVTEPVVLLADEPTGNLDSANSDEIIRMLKKLADGGQTIVMVTHNPRHAATANRVVELRDGQIVKEHRCTEPISYQDLLRDLQAMP